MSYGYDVLKQHFNFKYDVPVWMRDDGEASISCFLENCFSVLYTPVNRGWESGHRENGVGKGILEFIYGVFYCGIRDFLGNHGCRTTNNGRKCGGSGSGSSGDMGQPLGFLGNYIRFGRMCLWWISSRVVVSPELQVFRDASDDFIRN